MSPRVPQPTVDCAPLAAKRIDHAPLSARHTARSSRRSPSKSPRSGTVAPAATPLLSIWNCLSTPAMLSALFTSAVNRAFTASVGVPVTTGEPRCSPGGSAPSTIVTVYGGTPPPTPRLPTYGTPTVPLGGSDGKVWGKLTNCRGTASAAGFSLRTNPSKSPPGNGWNPACVTGKLDDRVIPAT